MLVITRVNPPTPAPTPKPPYGVRNDLGGGVGSDDGAGLGASETVGAADGCAKTSPLATQKWSVIADEPEKRSPCSSTNS